MPPLPIYLKHEMTIKDLASHLGSVPQSSLANKWFFVGIDLAPTESLETGITVIDRNRQIIRMDKLYDDVDLASFLSNLSPPENLIVALDIPKSLTTVSKWRQQQLKMHPGCLHINPVSENSALSANIPRPSSETSWTVPVDRFAQRAKNFYDVIEQQGSLVFGFFSNHAKLRYNLQVPFRDRSQQGCRVLQALIRQRLQIRNMPQNLVPSSGLDALIAAYNAWLLYQGTEGKHFKLYADDEDRLYLDPLKRCMLSTRLPRERY